ncbi:MAG: D-ribose pyranase [Bacteroidota bacterium]
MKKIGTPNRHLSRIIASMGHKDRLVICDVGLPIPAGQEVIDLALTTNVPRFLEALRVVLEELQVESVVIAREMTTHSNALFEEVKRMLPDVELRQVSHEEFKEMTAGDGTIAIVRTGEATPYANIILESGVTF